MSSIYLSNLYNVASAANPGTLNGVGATTLQALNQARSNVTATTVPQVAQASVNLNARLADAASLSARGSALSALSTSLQGFAAVLKQLTDTTQTAGVQGSSSDPAVTVVVGANAAPASAKLSVDQLAKAQVNQSNAVASASADAGFGAGSLTIEEGNKSAVQLTLRAGMSLNDIASAINGASANVQASVVQDGTNYRLQVTGSDTGAANEVTYTEIGASLGLAANQTQAAQDLTGSLNGSAYSSATNLLSDVFSGASLLVSATTANASLNLTASATSAVASVQAFVTGYNAAKAALDTAQASQPETGVLDSIRQQLARVAGEVSGNVQGRFNGLAQVGISTDVDGSLLLDPSKLSAAATLDALGVASLLSGSGSGKNGLAVDLRQAVLAYAQPGTGILAQNGYGLQLQAAQNGAAVLRESEYVDDVTDALRANTSYYQRLLADLTADALLVPLISIG